MSNAELWNQLVANMEKDAASKQAFEDDPISVLKKAGIETPWLPPEPPGTSPALETAGDASGVLAESTDAAGDGITVVKCWWGQRFIFSEAITKKMTTGVEGAGGVAAALAAAVSGVLAAGLAAAFIFKITEISLVDNGQGVYFAISWLQWGALVTGAALGPVGVASAAEVFLHPRRNPPPTTC